MPPRLSSRHGGIQTLAHRGASTQVPADSAEAFTLALRLGAGGIATRIRFTADRVPVISDEAKIGGRLRRQAISGLDQADLPPDIVTLEQYYALVGPDAVLALDVAHDGLGGSGAGTDALDLLLAVVREAGAGAEANLVLSSGDLDLLSGWRADTRAKLVLATNQRQLKLKPEQLAAELQRREIDGLSLPHLDWSPGLIAVVHRFGCDAVARGLEHERELANVIDIGIDAVSSAHVDRLVAVAAEFYPAP